MRNITKIIKVNKAINEPLNESEFKAYHKRALTLCTQNNEYYNDGIRNERIYSFNAIRFNEFSCMNVYSKKIRTVYFFLALLLIEDQKILIKDYKVETYTEKVAEFIDLMK